MRVWPVARVYCWRQTQAAILCIAERLYAGGATSHRGFAINSAGPRDLGTGYPVGGTGVLVNTLELRLPPPTLPYVETVSHSSSRIHATMSYFRDETRYCSSILFHQRRNACAMCLQTTRDTVSHIRQRWRRANEAPVYSPARPFRLRDIPYPDRVAPRS